MAIRRRTRPLPPSALLATTLAVLSHTHTVIAVDFGDAFQLHAYGSQDYIQATHNTYLGADNRGTWSNDFIGLTATATLNDKSKLWAQLEASGTGPTQFTWFFLDYELTGSLRARAGRVRFPLGIYNELIDTKFLQVTSLEPAIYQDATDIVHDSYTGVGLVFTQSLAGRGAITWEVYGGNIFDEHPPADSRDRRAYGGRVTYQTPFDGLSFLLSGYRTQVELLATGELINEDRYIVSVDYVHAAWDIKSEFGTRKFRGVDTDAYYVQVGRTLDKWMPFVRFDSVVTDTALSSSDSYSQRILVAGVNYSLRNNISLRIENHFNHGYALPVASGEVPVNGGIRSWNLLVAGLHFIL